MIDRILVRPQRAIAGSRPAAALVIVLQVALGLSAGIISGADSVVAADAVEFPGTVVAVDAAAGKFAVKKDGGGTRFSFVANDKTKFEGGPKTVADLKKDDHVVVLYQVQGSQYVAQKVTKGK